MKQNYFTEEELAIAKSVDLASVAQSLGYTPKRIVPIGCNHLQEMTMKELLSLVNSKNAEFGIGCKEY